MTPQPSRQLHASKIRQTDGRRSTRAQPAVQQCTPEEVASQPLPHIRQLRAREPAHAQLQRQVVADDDLRGARRRRDAVRGGGVDDAGSEGLGCGVDEEVQHVGDVEMRRL